MTVSVEGAHTCPNCGEKVTGRFAHVFYPASKCTIVELRPVSVPKANHIEGPLDRCPHCRAKVREGTMHTRQTGGRCTVTHVMRRVVSPDVRAQYAREDLKEGVRGIHPPGHTPQEPPHHVRSPERLTPRLKGHTEGTRGHLGKPPRRPTTRISRPEPSGSPTEGLEAPHKPS